MSIISKTIAKINNMDKSLGSEHCSFIKDFPEDKLITAHETLSKAIWLMDERVVMENYNRFLNKPDMLEDEEWSDIKEAEFEEEE